MNTRSTTSASLTRLGLSGLLAPIVWSMIAWLPASCAAPPSIDAWFTDDTELVRAHPNDVAVLKVEDATHGSTAAGVVEEMRRLLRVELVSRKYAPLSAVLVDGSLSSSAQPGTSILDAGFLQGIATRAKEDAILAVRIKHWDQSTLLVDNRVRFECDAVMYGSTQGKILWSCGMRGEVIAGGGLAAPRDPQARAGAAALRVVQELLRKLPERRTS